MTQNVTPVEAFVADFEAVNGLLAGNDLPWLSSLRRSGIEQFSGQGLPHAKLEAWKYTRLRPLEDTSFRPVNDADGSAGVASIPAVLPSDSSHPRIVFVNGTLRPDLSWLDALPDGVNA
ncbi:MAG: Fe-S cluster assembly protein SufD, partial [Rhodospirillaceae bacterium]|nr:Fe-S cluster assembly protein SufD [Rhodospirillaceae bacterium]